MKKALSTIAAVIGIVAISALPAFADTTPWSSNPQSITLSTGATITDALVNATCDGGYGHCGAPFALQICADAGCSSVLYTFEYVHNNYYGTNQPLDFPLSQHLDAGTYYFNLLKQDVGGFGFDGGGTITYTLDPPPAGAPPMMIIIPTSTAPSLSASMSATIANSGTLSLLAFVIGVPLTFYVIKQLLELIPKWRLHNQSTKRLRDLSQSFDDDFPDFNA